MLYGVERSTSDLDYLPVFPSQGSKELQAAAERVQSRYGLEINLAAVAIPPENYESRLIALYPGQFRNLRLFALEAHDLALTKLERNNDRDREDVSQMARAGHLQAETLRSRYEQELRPLLTSRIAWHDATIGMWLDAYFPKSGS